MSKAPRPGIVAAIKTLCDGVEARALIRLDLKELVR